MHKADFSVAPFHPRFQRDKRNDVMVFIKRHMMKQSILLLLGVCLSAQLFAQPYGGMWTGMLHLGSPAVGNIRFQTDNKIDPFTGHTIIPESVAVPAGMMIDSTDAHISATIEMIQRGEQMLAVLTSYGDDRRQITSYILNGNPDRRKGYLFRGESNIINETQGETPLFNLEGAFAAKDGKQVFTGYWRSQRSGNILGDFSFTKKEGPVTINPEIVYRFFKTHIAGAEETDRSLLPPASLIRDSIITTAFSIDASFQENGIIDKDTLSVWLNGRLLEDNIVPGKKHYLFRAKLENDEWNRIVIRCKSEGKVPGSGVLLNMLLDEGLRKYNLVLYKNDQAEWLIRRRDRITAYRLDE